jgi:hypothetical protein
MPSSYVVCEVPPVGEDVDWSQANVLQVDQFHSTSGLHRPRTYVRLLHDLRSFLLRFDVENDYAVSRATKYQDNVSRDSCVEFFVQPPSGNAYFNLELNCGGTMLLYFIEDPSRKDSGFAKYTPLPEDEASLVSIAHSMPSMVWPARAEPTSWWLTCRIPFQLFEAYVDPIKIKRGDRWRANFFKCASESRHPHWASWNAIGEVLNFHQPQCFGDLVFERSLGAKQRVRMDALNTMSRPSS